MKNNVLYLSLLILAASIASCVNEVNSIDQVDNPELSVRSNNPLKDYLVRDFGSLFAIYEVGSGLFFYCDDCNNSMNLSEDIRFNGSIELNADGTKLFAYSDENSPFFSVSLDRSTGEIYSDPIWQNITNYSVTSIGWNRGDAPESSSSDELSYIPTTLDDFLEDKPLCQCVGNTSTPCTSTYGDQTDGCDVGGPGATGCNATHGQGGSGSIMGNGGGGSQTYGCGVSCGEGFYACCDYNGG